MTVQIPERGSVIHYAYLWAREDARGSTEAHKDRPALVVAISVVDENDKRTIYAAAITHSPPRDINDAVALPQRVKRALGLDAEPAWIVTTELNSFVWPGPDIRPIPGRPPGTLVYGRIPDDLLELAVRSFLENRRKKRAQIVSRTS